MFEYFESNYPWNLATHMVLNAGGQIGEVDEVLRDLRGAARDDSAEANQRFAQAWVMAAEKVSRLARDDEARRRFRSAGGKYARASAYFFAAERASGAGREARDALYGAMLHSFERFVALRSENCVRVEIPFRDGSSLPALFVQGHGSAARKPCMVHFDGLDVNKEYLYLGGMPSELAARGVSTLVVDHPGVGEALRVQGLHAMVETEIPAAACVDWLQARTDIDPERIGIIALSLGGYYAPRAAAFEKRLRCCVAWGALYDVGEALRRRLRGGSAEKSVHHYFEHIAWVMGVEGLEQVLQMADRMTLKGLLDRITCPLLVVHGERDRQVPLEFAEKTFREAVNSAGRELKVHTAQDGGCEHCSVDNRSLTVDYMADWIARILNAQESIQ